MMRRMRAMFQERWLVRRRSYSWSERAILAWGKLRRFYLLRFRPGYVTESLKRRVGSCDRTGACCELMFSCPLLNWRDRMPLCRAYKHRPKNCTIFPIDERDLRDRDIVDPWETCGYTFLRPGETKEEEEERQQQVELAFHV